MFEQLSVFNDLEAGHLKRSEAKGILLRLFLRRWHGVWNGRPFPRVGAGPREETVMPKPQYL